MSEPDITRMSLGNFTVGITGLKDALEATKVLQGRPDAEIAQALLVRLASRNYIPASSREEYKRAFLREYKKAVGEKVAEERPGLTIKILGPGCPACDQLEQTVMQVLAELNLPAALEHVRDFKEIAALGVFATPALLINDEVKVMGSLPSREALKKWLQGQKGEESQ